MFLRWNSYSAILGCVYNMQLGLQCACSNVTISCDVFSLLYMTFTKTICCPPHPTCIIVNMDQMTMHCTYQWLQMTCTGKRKKTQPKGQIHSKWEGAHRSTNISKDARIGTMKEMSVWICRQVIVPTACIGRNNISPDEACQPQRVFFAMVLQRLGI
jgi:hypothetical protein